MRSQRLSLLSDYKVCIGATSSCSTLFHEAEQLGVGVTAGVKAHKKEKERDDNGGGGGGGGEGQWVGRWGGTYKRKREREDNNRTCIIS